jgi:glutathione peroxidase
MNKLFLKLPQEAQIYDEHSYNSPHGSKIAHSPTELKPSTIFDFKVPNKRGFPIRLNKFVGKKAYIIVNTFDGGGLRKENINELISLYNIYKEDLEILAFPSDDFGAVDSPKQCRRRSLEDIDELTDLPLFGKIRCAQGRNIHPLYAYLTESAPPRAAPVEWDFVKFLCDANGSVVHRYPPECSPREMEEDILELINDEVRV